MDNKEEKIDILIEEIINKIEDLATKRELNNKEFIILISKLNIIIQETLMEYIKRDLI